MKVSDVMTVEVVSCRSGDPLARAAEVMWERDCGCVPVLDGDERVLGLITDRDLTMAAWTQGQDLGRIPVERTLSGALCCARPDEALEEVLARMASARVRRVPVCDAEGRLVGLLSLADVLQGLERLGTRARRPLAEAVLSTLGAITRPRRERVAILLPALAQAPERAAAKGARASGASAAAGGAERASPRPAARTRAGSAKRGGGSGRGSGKR